MKQAREKSKSTAGKTGSDNVPSTGGRRTQVRKSNVHGKGVYAVRPIKAGEMVLEYKGKIITWRKPWPFTLTDPSQPNHTFYFHLDDGHVIDGKQGGNSARWINHGCEPNLEAEQDGNRVFLRALRDIAVGEELLFDYALMIEGRKTAKVRKEYACFCGAPGCRGTMLDIKK